MGEDVRGLQIQLSAALKERDDADAALRISNALNGVWSRRLDELEAENGRLETAARAYIEGHELAMTRAEAAESERDALRTEIADWHAVEAECGAVDCHCGCHVHAQELAALAGGGDRG